MEIDHDPHAQFLGPERHGHRFFFAAMAAGFILIGMHKNPKPNAVHAMVFEDFQSVVGFALVVFKHNPTGFHLGQPANICPFGEDRFVGLFLRKKSMADGQENQGNPEKWVLVQS
jgi:hypothetical protein